MSLDTYSRMLTSLKTMVHSINNFDVIVNEHIVRQFLR